jgi:TRAF3-interacting protein 1
MGSKTELSLNESHIEFIKKAIQILYQSTIPLGKLVDYVTENIDRMSNKYKHWRKETIYCIQSLKEQQQNTE